MDVKGQAIYSFYKAGQLYFVVFNFVIMKVTLVKYTSDNKENPFITYYNVIYFRNCEGPSISLTFLNTDFVVPGLKYTSACIVHVTFLPEQ